MVSLLNLRTYRKNNRAYMEINVGVSLLAIAVDLVRHKILIDA